MGNVQPLKIHAIIMEKYESLVMRLLKHGYIVLFLPIGIMKGGLLVCVKPIAERYEIMLLTAKSGRLIELPNDKEDELINAGIALDSDTYELSEVEFSQLKPYKNLSVVQKRIPVLLSQEIVERFQATGLDWQMRIDNALKEWLSEHAV